MWRSLGRLLCLAAALVLSPSPANAGDTLCSIAPTTYAAAKLAYPGSASALSTLEQYTIATWYTDRSDYASTVSSLVSSCSESTRVTVVVYGLPNKDCDATYSSGGTNSDAADYATFLDTLTTAIGDRKVLYVLEPDAIGLLANGGCADTYGYKANLLTAIEKLSANSNAEIYLDVGYWTLEYTATTATVVSIIQELAAAGSVKGITINTSNYQGNSELSTLCSNFQSAVGSSSMTCIFDTSRNYNGAPSSSEWCNVKSAGIGQVPTADTGLSNVDYFLWIKPPGESDGSCSGRTSDALAGPSAGSFFNDFFLLLWNQGAPVSTLKLSSISVSSTSTPSTTTATPATTTATPATTTTTPATTTATPTTTTATPTSTSASSSGSGAGTLAPYNQSTNSTTTAPATTTATPTTTKPATTPAQTATLAPKTTAASSTTTASTSGSSTEITTKSSAGSTMSTGLVVLVGLVGAALVALVAIVAVRKRQNKLFNEAKTPLEPYPSSLVLMRSPADSVAKL